MVTQQAAWEAPTPQSQPVESVAEPLIVDEPLIAAPVEGEDAIPEPQSEPAALPIAPPLSPDIQERLNRADQLEAQQRQEEDERAIANELQGLTEEATRRGIPEEDVRWFNDTQTRTIRRVVDNFRQTLSSDRLHYGQQLAAYKIAYEKGVDPQLLLDGRNPTEMRRMADRELRYQGNDARIKAVEQRQGPPPQPLNRTGTSQAGGQAVTADNIDALWLAGRVTDTTYRRFQDTGEIRS